MFSMMKRVLIALIAIIIVANVGYCAKPYYTTSVYKQNEEPQWTTYYKSSSACRWEVLTNGVNLKAVTISGEKGIIFVLRDIITSEREWELNYGNSKNSSKRENYFWGGTWETCYHSLGITVQYLIVYKDKYNGKYRSYCYNAKLFDVHKKIVQTYKDDTQSYSLPYLEDTPKLKLAIKKYLEINHYNSLDELFEKKGINKSDNIFLR